MNMQQTQQAPGQLAQSRYKSARWDLLIIIIFTVLNIVMLFTGSDTMMLFSATIPYIAVVVGYVGYYEGFAGFLEVSLALAGIILLVYLLCWIFSKKHYGWMIAALVLFSLDTLATVLLYSGDFANGIMDFVIHGIVIWYLAMGVKAGKTLKTLPEEVVDAEGGVVTEALPLENSAPIRWADPEVKHRVLVEAQTEGMRICYRSVKNVLELVINGYVYAETKMIIIVNHEQTAVYNGRRISAGFNSVNSSSYICVDGQQVAKKFTL